MIGFAFFMFEGIGCLMPVLKEVEKPSQFHYHIVGALALLCSIYICFSMLCYYAWGQDLNQPVVTEMLPVENVYVQILKLVFCLNLIFSYPLTSACISEGLQSAFFYEGAEHDPKQYWKVNALRSTVPIAGVIVSITVAKSLDKVISLMGAILGVTIVLMIPAFCHFKLLARTPLQKGIDVTIGLVALTMLFVGPVSITMSW
jgi:proton-coupled amino acid transporter